MVVDTSILLAIFFQEEHSSWAVEQLARNEPDLRMSVVNYSEALIVANLRAPRRADQIRVRLENSAIRLVPPTIQQAEIAAAARLRFPLNIGDCFAYALAKEEKCALLTLDRDFRAYDIDVVIPRLH